MSKRERKSGSSEFRRSKFVGPRTKVHRLDESYTYVPKMGDFTKDPKKEIWGESKFLGL